MIAKYIVLSCLLHISLFRSGMEDILHLRGSVVTQLCLDYGMIDEAVYFTSGEVLGGMPLKERDLVNCIAVRDGAQGGWKALRVRNHCILHKPANTVQVIFTSLQFS